MKIWAKIVNGDKIIRDIIYERELVLTPANYQKMLQEMSYQLDIATPVSLPTHFKHFERFNRIKYIPRDFIEEVDFTAYILERVIEKPKSKQYFM